MLSVARTRRTSEQIRTEIEQTFGFFPPFFEPALGSPRVLGNLWQQTLSAYVENPLSALFKEKLNALLSRFCAAPYCIIVHSSALRPLGMTAQQVLFLLEAPPSDLETTLPLGALPVPAPEEAASPAPDSRLEAVLLYCATAVFLERADVSACQAELRRLLGPDLYPDLIAYLAYIKTCHTWIEAHPEVSHEADRRVQDNLGPLLAAEPALEDFFRHYQERVRAQGLGRERRRAADESLQAAQAQTTTILESITDAFFALDRAWRFTYVNAQAERLLFRARAALLGRNIWAEFPAAADSAFEREYRRAAKERVATVFEEFYPPLSAWFEVRAFPSSEGLSVFFHDITKRVESDRRERFLADLAERARRLTDPDDVIADAVRSVGEFLGVSRCLFADIDIEADTCAIPPHYRADDSVASITGVFPISAFGPFVVAEYTAGRTAVVDDVRADRVKVPPESLAAYEAIGVRAYVAAPVLHSARLVSALAVHSAVPRHWTPEEVELLQTVVERTWLTVEVTRQQRALACEAEERERMLAIQREEHQRTANILASITDAFFTLDSQWRCTFVNDQADRIMSRGRDEVMGRNFWEVFPHLIGTVFDEQYHCAVAEGVAVSFEAFYPRLDAWLEVRAFPSTDGLSVYFRDISERKTLEAERAQIAEREHKIAQQLQVALTPAIPDRIPGMVLAKYYEAALTEARVGGDFYDVFPVDKGCTALIVGDLSGKGLAAASQVATVRNMLRYALYRARTLAGAVQGLNALLAEQELLTGFSTLFVGAFDGTSGSLTYVNAGQEPALVRRASGAIEPLPPTGPVLGSFEGALFEEETVTLRPGDAVAIFTDGLTEVGPSRAAMLGVEGVADLLAGADVPQVADSAQAGAEALTLWLIQGVDAAAAGGVTRDDVCLLVGVVE